MERFEDREPTRWSREREASPSLQRAVLLATRHVAGKMSGAGEFRGRTEGDAGDQARLLLTLLALGLTEGDRADRLADQLLASQLPTGGWPGMPGDSAEVSTSVLAYLAVKLHRGPEALPRLAVSRRAILALGGVEAVGDEAYAWLALFGQAEPRPVGDDTPWRAALAVDDWPAFGTLHGVRELHTGMSGKTPAGPSHPCTELADCLWRRLSLQQGGSDEAIARVEQAIECLISEGERDGVLRVSPHAEPEIDTALALLALICAGRHDEGDRAALWLANRADAFCQGEDFSHAALALRALVGWGNAPPTPSEALPPRLRVIDSVDGDANGGANSGAEQTAVSVEKAIGMLAAWLAEQQQPDGGWGADDVTALVVEALAVSGVEEDEPTSSAIAAGVDCLVSRQQPDGSWRSSRATDDAYATSRAVIAIAAAGSEKPSEPLLAGVNWLLATQTPSGGWGGQTGPEGETLLAAAATPTAWALEALTAADQQHSEACGRAAGFLLQTQHDTGEWREPHFVFRSIKGVPCRNDLRPTVVSSSALAAWASRSRQEPAVEEEVCLRVVRHDNVAS